MISLILILLASIKKIKSFLQIKLKLKRKSSPSHLKKQSKHQINSLNNNSITVSYNKIPPPIKSFLIKPYSIKIKTQVNI